jgi:hypothetical protein
VHAARAIVWGLGGHVIKCGLAPVLIDLMQRGYATAFAMNGAAAIHDFEIALAGHTSEDVEAVLPDGRFGAAEETGREMNLPSRRAIAIRSAWAKRWAAASTRSPIRPTPRQPGAASLARGDAGHGARGDRHRHAAHASGGGPGSHRQRHASRFPVAVLAGGGLHDGGVYLNVGSAVVLPEVFLKAVSAVRNLGHPLADFTTVNLDFLQHYRPKLNVVERPHAGRAGRGMRLPGIMRCWCPCWLPA